MLHTILRAANRSNTWITRQAIASPRLVYCFQACQDVAYFFDIGSERWKPVLARFGTAV